MTLQPVYYDADGHTVATREQADSVQIGKIRVRRDGSILIWNGTAWVPKENES